MQNKNFGILGLGISGLAAVKFFLKRTINFIAWDDSESARNRCADLLSNNHQSLTDNIGHWSKIDYLILTPGMPLYFPSPHPFVKIAQQKNIKIICDIELFYLYNPNNIYIGITGTNGKSTTTNLIYHILTSNNIKAKLAGNIGTPILSLEASSDEIIVIEMSSFQLDLIDTIKFDIAILLNITKDHLDRHGSMENYIKAKRRIFMNQRESDIAIISEDNDITRQIIFETGHRKINTIGFSTKSVIKNGVSVIDHVIYDDILKKQIPLAENKFLRGAHNAENIAASYIATSRLNNLTDEKIVQSISTYPGLRHRMEFIGECNNIEFINDSKATNQESAEKALSSFNNIYWIAGGIEKEGGIANLGYLFNRIKHTFLVGKSAENFASILDKSSAKYTIAGSLEVAFRLAVNMAEKDTSSEKKIVLLSPACASYDQWKNFEERGDFFTKLAKAYISGDFKT